MNIDDLYSDIWDVEPSGIDNNSAEDEKFWIFPIIGNEYIGSDNCNNGTGFFVNNDGYFITAGHVLKSDELTYKAIIDNKEFGFIILFKEYLGVCDQKLPICKDIAICKIEIKLNIEYFLSTSYPKNKTLHFSGYSKNPIGTAINPTTQSDLYLNHCQSMDAKATKSRIIAGDEDCRPICDNTRSLNLENEIRYNGISGGPVYLGKSIYGMMIGKEYILSEYITQKLIELKITYNT
jgi:hypothetical protein